MLLSLDGPGARGHSGRRRPAPPLWPGPEGAAARNERTCHSAWAGFKFMFKVQAAAGARADPEIPNSRPPDSRFGRESGREFPTPDRPGIGNRESGRFPIRPGTGNRGPDSASRGFPGLGPSLRRWQLPTSSQLVTGPPAGTGTRTTVALPVAA
jgi:hypothetical protein